MREIRYPMPSNDGGKSAWIARTPREVIVWGVIAAVWWPSHWIAKAARRLRRKDHP